MTTNEIQNLIRFIAKSGISEFELELKDFKIKINNPRPRSKIQIVETPFITAINPIAPEAYEPTIAAPSETIPSVKEVTSHPDESNYITVRSPMIGTFYRTPGPSKPPFVNVGDEVKKGQTLCVIEAMKLFNEIESEVSGKIAKILVDDSTPVEYDAHLFLIDPS